MCKGGSKTVNTEQSQYAETDQYNYTQANPLAYDSAAGALGYSNALTAGAVADPSTMVAGFNDDQIYGREMLPSAWLSAEPMHYESADMMKSGFGLTNEAADYARRGAGPVDLAELDIDKYLNPYANYALAGLNDSLFSKNKKNQGYMSATMGGVGGDRAAVAEAENLRQDNLARGQLMSGFYNTATGTAQQQQGAEYAKDVGNRDAQARTSGQILATGQTQDAIAKSYASLANMMRDSRVQAMLAKAGWGDMRQRQDQAYRDAPWKATQFLTQATAGLAPVIGGQQYAHGTQLSSGSGTQTTTTQQSPMQTIMGLGMMAAGAFTGNPMLAMGGAGSLFGQSGGPAGHPTGAGYGSGYWAKDGGRINGYAKGGKVSPYDVGGLVFDPELSDELYPVDRNSPEYTDMVFNPNTSVYEPPPSPEPEAVAPRDYYDRVESGEAPDFRSALLKYGQDRLNAPGNENYLNRNLPPQAVSPEPVNPFAGARAINAAFPMAPRGGMPTSALALDGDVPPPPPTVAPRRRTPSEMAQEIFRREMEREDSPAPEIPPLPDMTRRRPEPRSWGGVDGRLFEMGMRMLAGTADRDNNGVPTGFAAGLGKAGIGTMDNERKLREEARKTIDDEMDDRVKLDAMQRWRKSVEENARNHGMQSGDRRLRAAQGAIQSEETGAYRKAIADARIAEQRAERLRKEAADRQRFEIANRNADTKWEQVQKKWEVDKEKLADAREKGHWTTQNFEETMEDGSKVQGVYHYNRNTKQGIFEPGKRIMSKDRQATDYQRKMDELEKAYPDLPLQERMRIAKDPGYKDKDTLRREVLAASAARSEFIIKSKPYTDAGRQPPAGLYDEVLRKHYQTYDLPPPAGISGSGIVVPAPAAAPGATPAPSGDGAQKQRARTWLESRKKAGAPKPSPEFFTGQRLRMEDFDDILQGWN